ncbi:uncharacterized protein Z520_10533 [Fonsecaea multimorphosa CBS 102226]|uniref:Peptidase S33 tripeptidyl aminopeptidase-like C-terminal domain-containing protein n=1 Tax=Fonsecaea multimorphosa CBS 102226 TaxID=1442371 RepID=A0A0D2JK46_9EURO|nr:uncharacterized protein Z520_10533 [Fonsecaea multimorphosa CBS 102226]KIX93627.1 hypothetical protein Z520_10533 [Fonsecaea multimorphosa CBS 102226]OAL19742.1 hypothetical protein AYO22_09269 [Fonsecaea multimorphosa]
MRLGLSTPFGCFLTGLFGHGAAFLIHPFPPGVNTTYDFNWANVPPSRELHYHKCYDSFECARLEVPLDWSNLSNPGSVILAITRLPAVVDVGDDSFGGTVVINPGGPSGSGVAIVLWSGKSIQNVLDGDKHFEILSFDPRGVQFSTPSLACFQDDTMRDTLNLLGAGSGSLESNPNALGVKWGIDKSLGLLCAQTSKGRFPDGSTIRQFVSTALVAHDMVEIVDQVDAHLRKELKTKSNRIRHQQTLVSADSNEGPPLLNYWGLSYGTYLGNTFASMFPHRIGRMVLDGVVDADDYAATGWTSNLQDNIKTWTKFFEYCFEAGSKCALSQPQISGPEEMRLRVEDFLDGLKDNPLPLVQNDNAYILTYFNMKSIIHLHLYQPIQLWPLLALVLKALMEQDVYSAMSAWESWPFPEFRDFAPLLPNALHIATTLPGAFMMGKDLPLPASYPWQLESGVSILCGDGDDITFRSKEDFTKYLDLLLSQSPLVGSIWAEITLHCIHWPAINRPSAKNRFTGPFQSNLSDYDRRASPLLFIGNTADPVTPVRNAFKMAERHEGSVVVTQDMPGHCAGTTNPSVCTFGILRRFFAHGEMPEAGLVCQAAVKPWDI